MPSESAPAPTLVRVVAPHFVAGIELENNVCVSAAPILRWAVGKSADELRTYFRCKGWRASILPAQHSSTGTAST